MIGIRRVPALAARGPRQRAAAFAVIANANAARSLVVGHSSSVSTSLSSMVGQRALRHMRLVWPGPVL